MNGKIDLLVGQRKLVMIWLIGSAPVILLMLIRTLGPNATDIEKVWSWLLPSVMPTLSLVVGTYAASALKEADAPRTVDAVFFRIAVALSVAYLLILSVAIAAYPLTATPAAPALRTLERVGLILGPVQGLVSGCLGVFFVSQKPGR